MKDVKIICTEGESRLNGVSFDELEPIDIKPTNKDVERVIKQCIDKIQEDYRLYRDAYIEAYIMNAKKKLISVNYKTLNDE